MVWCRGARSMRMERGILGGVRSAFLGIGCTEHLHSIIKPAMEFTCFDRLYDLRLWIMNEMAFDLDETSPVQNEINGLWTVIKLARILSQCLPNLYVSPVLDSINPQPTQGCFQCECGRTESLQYPFSSTRPEPPRNCFQIILLSKATCI